MKSINSDIVCIQETHLKENNTIYCKDYKWFGHNRVLQKKTVKKGSGGIGIFVKNSVLENFSVDVPIKNVDGILGLKFVSKSTEFSFLIFCCYLPPDGSLYANPDSFYSQLIQSIYLNSNVDLLIMCGDFNSRIGKEQDFINNIDSVPMLRNIDTVKNVFGDTFLEFLKDLHLCIINGRVTPENHNFTCINSKGMSVVDYFVTFHDNLNSIKRCETHTMAETIAKFDLFTILGERCKAPDHSFLSIDITFDNVETQKSEKVKSQNEKCSKKGEKVPKLKKFYLDYRPSGFMNNYKWHQALSNIITNIETAINQQLNLEDIYNQTIHMITTEMETHLKFRECSKKSKQNFKHTKPYWTDTLTKLWKSMNEKERLYIKCKDRYREKQIKKNDFLIARKEFDKTLRYSERQYNKQFLGKLEVMNTNNPKDFWRNIKHLGPRKQSIPMEVEINGKRHSNSNIVLEKWASDFEQLLNEKKDHSNENEQYQEIVRELKQKEQNSIGNNGFLNHEISLDEVRYHVYRCKNNKSPGIDNIPYEVLKCDEVILLLFKLFGFCFKNNIVPSDWSKAIICPIPKGSSKNPYSPLSYRGISLLPCISKIYTSILNSRITFYLEDENLLVDEQNGFRDSRSCEDHVFSLATIIQNRLYSNKDTFIAFVDFSKAFDSVDRNLLLHKLLKYNINGNIYMAIKRLYSDTQNCIRLNNMYTRWFPSFYGVRQGDSLSPTLFSVFLNDLANAIKSEKLGITIGTKNVGILMYADDVVLIADDESKLQREIDILKDWCIKWKLNVNLTKSQVMHFRKSRKRPTKSKFMFGDKEIEMVAKYKYLGIIFDENLNFTECATTLADSAGRALGSIISKFTSFKNIMFNTFTKLYETTVWPILDYCSSVWSYKKHHYSTKIQNRASRYFLGVHKNAPDLAVQGDMGWLLVEFKYYMSMLRLWNKLVKLEPTRITRCIFEWDLQNFNPNSWCGKIWNVFELLNMYNVFENGEEINLIEARNKLSVVMHSIWCEKLAYKPKLRTYAHIKNSIETEHYLKGKINKFQRSLLTQLRIGILPLAVETGRYYRVPFESRTCQICKGNHIEDEIHFVCECKCFYSIRHRFYEKFREYFSINEMDIYDQFCNILKVQNVRLLADYINELWNTRKSILYQIP